MGLFNWNKKEPVVVDKAPEEKPLDNGKKGGRLSDRVNKHTPDRTSMQLGNLRTKIMEAKDPNNPSWLELYKIYENTMTDAEVITQRRIAENKLKAEPFVVRSNNADNDGLKTYFEKPWFDKFREFLIYKELFGYRVAEFGQFDEDNEFLSCKLFPLYNIFPHNRNIIIDETDTAGIPFANDDPEKGDTVNPYDLFLLELGDPEDLGLLEALSREVIIKSFARRDWNEHSEKWGQPRIVIRTEAEGTDLNTIERGASNFSRNGYAIVGIDDEIEKFEASNNGSGYLIYDKNIDKADMYIAKIINGQYGIGNEQSFVGTAEVAERILDDFMFSRLQEAQNIINYELIPFLAHWGYPLENATFVFPRVEEYKKRQNAAKQPETPNDGTEIDESEQESEEGEKTQETQKGKGKKQKEGESDKKLEAKLDLLLKKKLSVPW